MKKILVLFLALSMALSLCVPASADNDSTYSVLKLAQADERLTVWEAKEDHYIIIRETGNTYWTLFLPEYWNAENKITLLTFNNGLNSTSNGDVLFPCLSEEEYRKSTISSGSCYQEGIGDYIVSHCAANHAVLILRSTYGTHAESDIPKIISIMDEFGMTVSDAVCYAWSDGGKGALKTAKALIKAEAAEKVSLLFADCNHTQFMREWETLEAEGIELYFIAASEPSRLVKEHDLYAAAKAGVKIHSLQMLPDPEAQESYHINMKTGTMTLGIWECIFGNLSLEECIENSAWSFGTCGIYENGVFTESSYAEVFA